MWAGAERTESEHLVALTRRELRGAIGDVVGLYQTLVGKQRLERREPLSIVQGGGACAGIAAPVAHGGDQARAKLLPLEHPSFRQPDRQAEEMN